MSAEDNIERLRVEFGRLGSQYYISGRFAILNGLVPVGATLLHHAIEMYLKAGLCPHLTLEKVRSLSHDLKQSWSTFCNAKALERSPILDNLIAELNQFERIRYPDTLISEGAEFSVAPTRKSLPQVIFAAGPRAPEYKLVIREVDQLVSTILRASSINSVFFFGSLRGDARKYLLANNCSFADDGSFVD